MSIFVGNDCIASSSGTIEVNEIEVGDFAYSLRTEKTGYILCDGRTVSRTTYSKLFEVIGTKFGSGDGNTTFNVPNLKGKFLQGFDDAHPVGTYNAPGLPNITGEVSANQNMIYGGNKSLYCKTGNGYTHYNGTAGNSCKGIVLDASRSSSIYGASNTVQPPAITCNIFIKY